MSDRRDRDDLVAGPGPLGPEADDPVSTAAPAEMLAAIRAQQEVARKRTEPSTALLFSVWGVVYVVGYLTLWWGFDDAGLSPAPWAFLVFAAAIVSGVAITAVHIARRTAGIRGVSSQVGAMYGWAWIICFAMAASLFGALARFDLSAPAMATITNTVSMLIVSALYMVGAAIWREWRMFALGAWIAAVGSVSAFFDPPASYLVQAIAGGGGFLLAALVVGGILGRRP